jgi:DNA gyrase subunit A
MTSKTTIAQAAAASLPAANTGGQVIDLDIGDLMKRNYIDYAVAVITDRALPDVRDGLKPVHRRILYAMHGLRMLPGSQHKKSARMVGEVIGKYHPHGDTAVYDAAVIMAQHWSRRVPLIDGQGNFGSLDGDSPAAMRYTEMRMTRASASFFDDVDKRTVDYKENYDGSESEPVILPVTYPNVWVNGTDGIAVGMATNVLPHNLNETVDAFIAWMDDNNIAVEKLMEIMPGPDFPTGAVVFDLDGYKEALLTGKGRVKARAKYRVEKNRRGQEMLVIEEIPYRVNKATLHEEILDLIRAKEIEDAISVRDESSKDEVRLVVDLRKGCYPEVVFNQLVAKTQAETSYSYNVMLLEKKHPRQFSIYDIFKSFYTFRMEVVRRRTQYLLDEASARLHILTGLIAALSRLDETIATIRMSKNREAAIAALQTLLTIDFIQAKHITQMQLGSLTSIQIDEVRSEFNTLTVEVADYRDILAREERVRNIIKDELALAKTKFGSPRRTEVSHEVNNITMADLVKKEPCIVHMTQGGYIKRMSATNLNRQNRYTQGKAGIVTGDEDFVRSVYSGSTHDLVMLFTETGHLRSKRAWNIPEGTPSQKGRHIRNIFDNYSENIGACLFVPSLEEEGVFLVTVTAKGKIKRTPLSEYAGSLRKVGLQALNIEEGDQFVGAAVCREYDHVMLGLSDGRVIRIEVNEDEMRPMGRLTSGVRGVRILDEDRVLSLMVVQGNGEARPMKTIKVERQQDDGTTTLVDAEVMDTSTMDEGRYLLVVGKNGVGKRTPIEEYLPQRRGGKGVMGFNINKKTGPVVCMDLVTMDNDVVLTTQSKTNRIHVGQIRQAGRVTAGSFIMDTNGEHVMGVATVPTVSEEDVPATE